MILLTASQMQQMDRITIEEIGIPGLILMENAGAGCARVLVSHLSHGLPAGTVVLAGPGNNGGDGFVIARHLHQQGRAVRILCMVPQEKYRGDALTNLEIALRLGIKVDWLLDEDGVARARRILRKAGVIVDALFGTGLSRQVAGRFAMAVEEINRSSAPVFSVDIASGLSADSGQPLGCAVRADVTATMAYAKVGHVTWPGRLYTGLLEVIDIGIPASLEREASIKAELLTEEDFKALVRPRPADGHKGTFGHLLVLSGSRGKIGAAALVAQGALRGGAGLVTVATAASARQELALKLTEAMTEPLSETGEGTASLDAMGEIMGLLQRKRAVAIGPGFGINEETQELSRRIISDAGLSDISMVIDADGLTAIAGRVDLLRKRAGGQTVLTPHPAEAARLLSCSTAEIQADRVEAARAIARAARSVVVLKGFATVTARADGYVSINPTGNSGQGSGGMGDTLTGIIGALLAQGYSAWDAARVAVYAHGAAADLASKIKGPFGYLASDVSDLLPVVWKRALSDQASLS